MMPLDVRRRLEPRVELPVSVWSQEHPFLITEKGAAQPGVYDPQLTPYMREPLDAAGMPGVRRMNWAICPQGGKTKGAEVVLAWRLKYRPSNWLYIRPTEPDIDEAIRDRFVPMIEANLQDLIPRIGNWYVLSKNQRVELTNAIIYGAAATLARQLTSRTAASILYDETDTGEGTGNSLGNVLDVSDDRQMAVAEDLAFTLGCSSVKYDTGSNWVAYDSNSDRREYWEPCPHCGRYQILPAEAGLFESHFVTVDDERDPLAIVRERLARFVCARCGTMIEDKWQGWMCDRGVWVPRGQWIEQDLPLEDDDIRERRSLAWLPDDERWEPELLGPEPNNPHRGYRVWAANLKAEQRSWSHMLAKWFEAVKSRDPQRIQVVVNSWKSLPWKEALKAPDEEHVRKRIAEHPPGLVPSRAKLVLGGIDLQETGVLHYDFWAIGKVGGALTYWTIDSGSREVVGENFELALQQLYDDKAKGWPVRGREKEGWRMRPYAMAIDSGHRTGEAYEFARNTGVVAVKGQDDANYRIRMATVEGKLSDEPVELYWINVKVMGNRFHRLLIEPIDVGGAGFWMHADTEEDYVRQVCSEELRRMKNGKTTWQPKTQRRANHRWDIGRYILGLVEILEQAGEVSVQALTEDDHPLMVFVGEDMLGIETTPPPPAGGDGGDGWMPPMGIPGE